MFRSRIGIATLSIAASLATHSAYAQECHSASILSPSPFMGNNDEIFKLSDGSVWQVKYEYEYLYEYFPSVVICPGRSVLIIKNKPLTVQLMSGSQPKATSAAPSPRQTTAWALFEETNLEGSISGTIQRGHIFKTVSGNIYEVTGITLQLVLELQPKVMVLQNGDTYQLIVAGFDEPLICKRLNQGQQSIGTARQSGGGSLSSVIESSVDGTFTGWDGRTIVKLANGQIWQQTQYFYTYHYAYAPQVIVYSTEGAYKMKVDGVDEAVGVVLLR